MSGQVVCGRAWVAVLAAGMILSAANARAGAESGSGRSTIEADLVGAANPEGLLLSVGGFRRWTLEGEGVAGDPTSPYLQSGLNAGLSPAYASGKVHAEWMPHPALQLRAQYGLTRYAGANGALLSFPSRDADFGRRAVDDLEDEDEEAWGQHFLLRPTVRLKLGPVLLRNATDVAYCRFGGRGPYFLDWDYDTLVRDKDWVISDSVQALFTAWSGQGAAALYTGPFFEITHAQAAGITQERAGLAAAWTVSDRFGPLARPRAYGQAGVHLRDPNREGELFVVLGVGFDID